MARLRLTGSTVGFSPAQNAQVASPVGDALQHAGRSLAEAGGVLAEREERLREARRKRDYFRHKLGMEDALRQVDDEFSDDDDFGTLEGRVSDRVAETRSTFLQGIDDSELREDLAAEFDLYGSRWMGQFRKEAFRRERDASVAGFDADTNQYLNRYINAPDEATRAAMMQDYQAALGGMDEWLTPGESVERMEAFRRAGDFGRAKADIDRTKGAFDPEDYQHLDPGKVAQLDEYAGKVRGKALVARAIDDASAMLDADDPESLRRAVDAVRGAGLDEDQQAEAVRAVKADYSLGVSIKAQQRQQSEEDAWDGFLAARDGGAPMSVKDVLAMDIGASQKRAMIATLEADVRAAKGGEVKTDMGRYFQVQEAIEGGKVGSRGQLLTMAGGKVSNADLRALEGQWSMWRDERDVGLVKPMTVLKDRFVATVGKDKDELFKFQMAVNTKVALEEKKQGRRLGSEEVVKIGLEQMAKEVVKGGGKLWGDRTGRAYENTYADVYGGREMLVDAAEIPEDAQRHIEAMLVDDGREVNEEAVRSVWKQYGEKVLNYEVK